MPARPGDAVKALLRLGFAAVCACPLAWVTWFAAGVLIELAYIYGLMYLAIVVMTTAAVCARPHGPFFKQHPYLSVLGCAWWPVTLIVWACMGAGLVLAGFSRWLRDGFAWEKQ